MVEVKKEKKYNYVYIFYKLYSGKKMASFCKDMGIGRVMMEEWVESEKEEVQSVILKEIERSSSKQDNEEVPSVQQIKDKILRRINLVINAEIDPSKLARALEILEEFGKSGENKTNKKTLYDELKETTNEK